MKEVAFMVVSLYLVILSPVVANAADRTDYAFLQGITRKAYPHAHAVLARERETVEFHEDGTSMDSDEVFLTVLDQDGVRQNSVTTFYINRHYSKLKIELFEVIDPCGHVNPVNISRYAREESSAENSRMNIYDPALRDLKVFVPELHIGDTIHYRIVQNDFKSMIPGEFFGRKRAEYTFPVKDYSVTIKGPESVHLNTLIKDLRPGTCVSQIKRSGGKTVYRFVFQNVPALVPEPAMPPVSEVNMRLLYSTIGSWKGVSRWYSRLVEPHLVPSPEITEKVQELTRGRDRAGKIAALYYFVAQKIRYLGITAERDRPGYEPHDVSLTFSRRYGVCRDKAALLVTMLREAGFRAVPVIVSVGNRLDPEVVVPWFNHAITAILDDHGNPWLYLDPTSETSRQFLPDYERDSSCLPASDQGYSLMLTPEPDSNANLSFFRIEDRIDEKDRLSGTITCSLTGFCDTALRGAMMDSSHERRRQIIEELLRRRIPGLIIRRLSWSDPADRSTPLSFKCSFEVFNRIRVLEDGCRLFYPLANMEYIGVIDKYLWEQVSLSKRRFPLRFGYVAKSVVQEDVTLSDGPGRDLLLPESSKRSCKAAEAMYRAVKRGGRIEIKRSFQIKALEVPVDDYRNLLEIQEYLQNMAITPVILSKY